MVKDQGEKIKKMEMLIQQIMDKEKEKTRVTYEDDPDEELQL